MAIESEKDQVRLLISDVGGQSGNEYIFSDEEIETILGIRGTVLGASALALRTLATNEALVSKRIKFLELTTDGPAVAKALLELAREYDKQDDKDVDDTGFAIAEMAESEFARRRLRGIEI